MRGKKGEGRKEDDVSMLICVNYLRLLDVMLDMMCFSVYIFSIYFSS